MGLLDGLFHHQDTKTPRREESFSSCLASLCLGVLVVKKAAANKEQT
jgi:hypothetical protein